MTKKMNRLAAQEWAEERARKEREEAEAARLKADLEALRSLRSRLLNNWRGEASEKLRDAIDDYAGHLTGDREFLWSKDGRQLSQGTKKDPTP
ncbi:MAG: hypothetical protein J0G95_10750 [Rhizobiales bacterium]|nr:hypothetical protein [Hyphomicrobiales bacterium]